MAMTVRYVTFDGVMLLESRGGVQTTYIPDTLGSLMQCRDTSGNKTYSAEYWPYGEVRTSTGTNPSPWGFVGLMGYLTETLTRLYVRARHYRADLTRWMTVDKFWPNLAAFRYVSGYPVLLADPSGMDPFSDWAQGMNRCFRDLLPVTPIFPPDDYRLPYPRFNPNPVPSKWGYGNWCGQSRPGDGNEKKLKPIDALDSCCLAHDGNLGKSMINGENGCSHCMLSACAKGASCANAPSPIECEIAKHALIEAMNLLCSIERTTNLKCIFA